MKPAKRKRTGRFVVLGLVAAVGLFYSGVTFAAPTPPSSINTCTKVTKKGALGKTKVTPASTCSGTQIFQNWNQAPADNDPVDGDPIVWGSHSGSTLTTSLATIATLTIPQAGSYSVVIKGEFVNHDASIALETCQVTNGDSTEETVPSAPDNIKPLLLLFGVTVNAGGTVVLQCSSSNPNNVLADVQIIATAGTSLNGPSTI